MEKRIINFKASGQSLQRISGIVTAASDTVRYFEARFVLDESWEDFDSVRAIWVNGDTSSVRVLNHGVCEIPSEVLTEKNKLKVNLVGSTSEGGALVDRLTTFQCPVFGVTAKVPIDSPNPPDIPASQVEQFAAIVRDDADRAEVAAEAAEASASAASASATSAANSATAAHNDKIAIEQAIAEVIRQIQDFEQVEVKVNTLPPGSDATSDFVGGVLTLGIPRGDKGDTGNGIQSIAKTSTSGLVDTYTITFTDGQITTFTVTNGAKGDTGNGISSIVKTSTVGLVDTYTITYTDGTTSTFTVTNGEKGDKGDTGEVSLSELEDATIVQTLSDTEPYHFRRTNNGQGSGHREYDEIVGASVGWNQIYITPQRASSNGIVFERISDSVMQLSGTATSTAYRSLTNSPKTIVNHVYYVDKGADSTLYEIYNDNAGVVGGMSVRTIIGKATAEKPLYVRVPSGSDFSTALSITPQIIDLTLFNSTIADYVYTLEQSTAGSGVTWLKKYFDLDTYHAYDSGSIKSVGGLTAHEMTGVNQWDEEWELGTLNTTSGAKISITTQIRSKYYIPVIGGESYHVTASPSIWCIFYDADKKAIHSGADRSYLGSYNAVALGTTSNSLTIPSEARYMKFYAQASYGATYKNDICINFSDASINGQYFPYEKRTYPLDPSVTLRGKFTLDGDKLKASGDVWKSDGEIECTWVEVTYDGSVDEDWRTRNDGTDKQYFAIKVGANGSVSSTHTDILSNRIAWGDVKDSSTSIGINLINSTAYNGAYIYVRESDTASITSAQFRTKLASNPLTVVYAVVTPTTEQATPYDSPQWCDSNGTEEYVGSELPVGHNSEYPMTLVDTMPSSNGTYEPRVTINNGNPSVSWVMPANASMIAPTETSYVATRNYTSGSLLIVNGTLYKATANIANNGNIVPNTNCVATTLAEVISALA